MSDDVNPQTESASQDEAASNPAEKRTRVRQLSNTTNWFFTVCYTVCAIFLGYAGNMLFSSPHTNLSLILLAIFSLILLTAIIAHFVLSKRADGLRRRRRRPINWGKVRLRILQLFVVAGLAFLGSRCISSFRSSWAEIGTVESRPTPTSTPSPTPSPDPTPRILENGRIVIGLTPEELHDKIFADGLTSIQVGRVIDSYTGKWIMFSAVVHDVWHNGSTAFGYREKEPYTLRFSDEKQQSLVRELNKNDSITVLCKIAWVRGVGIEYEACELMP